MFTVTSPLYEAVEPAFIWLLGSVPIYQRNAGAVPAPLELFGNYQETELAPVESVVNVNLATWLLPEFIPIIVVILAIAYTFLKKIRPVIPAVGNVDPYAPLGITMFPELFILILLEKVYPIAMYF